MNAIYCVYLLFNILSDKVPCQGAFVNTTTVRVKSYNSRYSQGGNGNQGLPGGVMLNGGVWDFPLAREGPQGRAAGARK